MSNPLKGVIDIKRGEIRLALLMFSYFFLVITSFWILKPLKKGLFIRFYDRDGLALLQWHLSAAQAEQLAKVLNILVAFSAAVVFTWLARRFRRQQLTYFASLFFLGCYVFYFRFIELPSDLVVWSFYLFGDLFSTVMVATFFAFLNDSVTPAQAKRLYGLIGLGGVSGGAFGSLVVFSWINRFAIHYWLAILFFITLFIMLVACFAGRSVRSQEDPEEIQTGMPAPHRSVTNVTLEGSRLVFRSRYLLAILGIVGLYEVVSTIMDFQFTATIAHYLDDAAIDRQFATIYVITNFVAMFVQFFMTSFIMTHFGLTGALLVLPLAVLLGSAGFLVAPALWVGSLLNTADGGFAYSINQSAKEALYVPTTRDEKYKAKAFIDMFVQRVAKATAVAIGLLITSLVGDFESMRWLSLITFGFVSVWILAVRSAGRRFPELAQRWVKKHYPARSLQ